MMMMMMMIALRVYFILLFFFVAVKHGPHVPETRVLWRRFGPGSHDVTGGCRKLHSENFHVL